MKKNILKKWVAGMCLPVVCVGAVGGVVSGEAIFNSSQINAKEVSVLSVNDKRVSQFPLYVFRKTSTSTSVGSDNRYGSPTDAYSKVKTINSVDEVTEELSYKYSSSIDVQHTMVDVYTKTIVYYGYSFTDDYNTVTDWSSVVIKKVDDLISDEDNNVYLTINGDRLNETIYLFSKVTNSLNRDFPTTTFIRSISSVDDVVGKKIIYSKGVQNLQLDTMGSKTPYTITTEYGYSKTNDVSSVSNWGNVIISKESEAIIHDTSSPVFEKQVFMYDVDNPPELSYILSQTSFKDDIDGVYVPKITDVTEDNYTANKNKVGKWLVKVKHSDNSGNECIGEIEMWGTDKTAPIITGTSVFTSNMSSPLTLESIKSQIHVSDNIDEELTLDVIEDNFTGKENVKGEKIIKLSATDTSGNVSAVFIVRVNCVDDIKPTITLKDSFNSHIQISYTQKFDISKLDTYVEIKDNIDTGLVWEKIDDKYSNNYTIPSTYQIKYRVTDTSGNVSDTFTFEIEVIDDVAPGFYVSDRFIGISKAITMSHQDIVNWLLRLENLETNSLAEVKILSLGGYDVLGVNEVNDYKVRYVTRVGSLESDEKTAIIRVIGEEVTSDSTQKDKEEQSKNHFVEEWKRFWKNVGEFFVKLWKSIVKYIAFGWVWDKDKKYDVDWKAWY